MNEAQAIAGLVNRWLHSFGPGTELDLKWWTGLGVTKIRAALKALDAVPVDLDGQIGFLLPHDLDPVSPPDPWVAFLPSLDPTGMGWKDRHWYLGDHEAELFDRNGNIGPTVWADGRIVGGWAQLPDCQIRFKLLEDTSGELKEQARAEAAALEAWFDGTVVEPRFPTPLDKRLRN